MVGRRAKKTQLRLEWPFRASQPKRRARCLLQRASGILATLTVLCLYVGPVMTFAGRQLPRAVAGLQSWRRHALTQTTACAEASQEAGDREVSIFKTTPVPEQAQAVLDSVTLRAAAELLTMIKKKEGPEVFNELIDAACNELSSGSDDYSAALIGESRWPLAGVAYAHGLAVAKGVVRMLSPGRRPDRELESLGSDERRGILKLTVYDQLPDAFGYYARILEQEDADSFNRRPSTRIVFGPEITGEVTEEQELAARFLLRLERIPSEEAKLQARFSRFQEYSLASELARRAQEDPELSELAVALQPWALRIYNATRTAQLRQRALTSYRRGETSPFSLQVTPSQLFGGLLVFVSVVVVVLEMLDMWLLSLIDESLPLY